MLDRTETAELKSLHARAYGRGGRLSAEELARLSELEEKRRGVAAEGERLRLAALAQPVSSAGAPHPPLNDRHLDSARAQEPDPNGALSETDAPSETAAGVETDTPPDTTPPRPKHPRLRWLVAGAAAILAIGVGIGWTLWGQTHDAIALTDEQRGWQEELAAANEYDPGSFVALREEGEIVVWTATQREGERTCILMSNGNKSSFTCTSTENMRSEGMRLELQVPTDEEGTYDVTSAQLLFNTDGHPAVAIDNYRNSFGAGPEYDPEDQKILDLLVDHGYSQSSMWIVGYLDDRPIWSAADPVDVTEQCLVYMAASGAIEEDCATWQESLEDPLTLMIGPDGARSSAAEIVYATHMNGPQYLTVTMLPVSDVTVDTETGDVIEFTIDEPMFDDLVKDDDTGE